MKDLLARRVGKSLTPDALTAFSGFGFMDEQTFRGLEFLEFRASWMEPYDDWVYEPKEMLDAGASQVVVLLHQRGKPHDSDSWVGIDYGMLVSNQRPLGVKRQSFGRRGRRLPLVPQGLW
jgi:hypothetical protein